MLTATSLRIAFVAAALVAGAHAAEPYPNKPIRLLTAEAGGGSDFLCRVLAPPLSARLGQQVIVDNRGLLAAEIAARAPGDGYTILLNGSTLWVLPLMREKPPYDPVGDFTPITLATHAPNILVVPPNLPAKSVKELIDLARAKPGELNYATSGAGNSVHIASELFRVATGINVVRINYKGAAPARNDLIAGQVQFMFGVPGGTLSQVRAGRLRAIGVTSLQPSPLAPGLPPVAATVPGYESLSYLGIYAPARTPKAIVQRLNEQLVQVLALPEIREQLLNSGVEPVGSSADQFAGIMRDDMAKMKKLIAATGMRDQ